MDSKSPESETTTVPELRVVGIERGRNVRTGDQCEIRERGKGERADPAEQLATSQRGRSEKVTEKVASGRGWVVVEKRMGSLCQRAFGGCGGIDLRLESIERGRHFECG
jgi:hypothetical protein